MASASEIILPIGTQKHDPAWKHCLMIRSGGRTKLKCMYCMKPFQGGGIHRIKEHLARHKGNASCCPKVPPEVQVAMQQSLEGAAVRKKKKLKLPEEVKKVNSSNNQAEGDQVEAALQMIPVPEMLGDIAPVQVEVREEGMPKERGRKKRARYTSPPPPPPLPPLLTALEVGVPIKPGSGATVDKDQVYMAIGRFLYEAGVPLDAVNSVYFQPMLDAIASAGPGLEMFSYHDFRGWILKRSFEEVNNKLLRLKGMWGRTGCSILADEWTTETGKTLINFLVYCPEGTMFLKSVDASHIVNSADTLYELLKHVVEEVGATNVVQVITNNAESHVVAGKRMTETFPTLFWTPCASRCIDAMLEDIGKLEAINEVIENAKTITGFIYNHAIVLNMMRKYTNGKDLIIPSDTRAAMNFITLKSMTSLKEELRAMVSSEEWMECLCSKKPGGIAMANLIGSLEFWSSCAAIVRITEPIVRVLKLVDSNKRPAMGYIYVAMHQVKQAIKKELVKKRDYMTYWDIIDWRWDRQLPRPLHAAGFFLNPQFFYSIQGEVSNEVSSGMLDCIERLVPETKVQDKIQKELSLYKSAAGDLGRKMAVRARHTLLPAEWWSTYGGGCPNLMRLAVRILSQTCSARGCERMHIPFEQIHNQRMNYLEHQRLCDLIFVRYNLRLQQRQLLKSKPFDPISIDNIDTVDDWILEKSELLSGADEDPNWMVLNPPLASGVLSENSDDVEVEAFIAGLDDEVIQGAGQDAEDDDDIKEEDESHDGTSFTCN
ncbi:uncharacterized protein LOC103704145 [Phoenix dactylifera]|uniref:Uncharacterized protein LOC103704145 n=1 Tax=Phoenix dactylifera TaxID=42345 RepID=A0A8B9AAP0_PHODC|nr:uncharacterized protein LOC103704145 [Phoenix dactylifera]XP_038980984.1 uncharacterized protein LOC103704145 [Phoenix dactylifera]